MMRAKATTTGPLDLNVRELRRHEETDMERDMVNDGSDTKYQSCSELRLDGGVGSLTGSTH